MRGLQGFARLRGERAGGEGVFEGAEQERERCPKLVGDVLEEGRFGAVDLGEGGGALPLGFERPHACERRSDALGHKGEQAPVAVVERAVGAERGYERPGRLVGAGRAERQHNGFLRRAPPGRRGQGDAVRGQIAQAHRAALVLHHAERPRLAGYVRAGGCARGVLIHRDERKREVGGVAAEHAHRLAAHVGGGGSATEGHGEVAQRAQAPFADAAVGLLGHHAQHPRDGAGVVGKRAVGKGVVGLFRIAVAL